ncbi:MAG TPA: hypothetical protein VHP33_16230 [Polyangiaceae bacterium]|nr:hypothetical protein [Polyangiaceae bacterium]
MKHVYVETNFVIDLLRPFASKGARALRARHGQDLTLHVPWCSLTEAKRTLEAIIREDLGFVDNAGRFLGQLGAAADPTNRAMQTEVRRFLQSARDARLQALFDFPDRLEALARDVDILQPSPRAAQLTVDLFRRKALKPFDEMVLGAVLADAELRRAAGEGPLYLCNLNTRDFEPTSGNDLVAEYARVGLTYVSTFDV